MSIVAYANEAIRRLEADLAKAKDGWAECWSALQQCVVERNEAQAERDNAARNERIRIAERADALAKERRDAGANYLPDCSAARALEALAAELRADGGGE